MNTGEDCYDKKYDGKFSSGILIDMFSWPNNWSCFISHSHYNAKSAENQRLLLPAEREGFEPPDLLQSTVFKTAAFDRSAISPRQKYVLNPNSKKKIIPAVLQPAETLSHWRFPLLKICTISPMYDYRLSIPTSIPLIKYGNFSPATLLHLPQWSSFLPYINISGNTV